MRPTPILALVALVLAGGLVWLAATRGADPAARASETASPAGDHAAEIAELRARVEALERASGARAPSEREPMQSTPVETAPAAASDDDLRARVDALEAAIAGLRRQGVPIESETEADALFARLEKNLKTYAHNNEEARAERQAIRERFLQLFADDPRAADVLKDLSSENLTREPAEAVAALDRWRGRVKIDPWRFDGLYANALGFAGRIEDADRTYQRIVDDPGAPEPARWDARFFGAYLHMQRGDANEARLRFEAIVREIEAMGSPARLENVLGGAKNQLEELGASAPK